eukprot:jgi/Psemu1/306361/fgenesh1_kg.252_\
MRALRTFSRRCSHGVSRRTTAYNNGRSGHGSTPKSATTTGGTTKQTAYSFGATRSRHTRSMGCCASSISLGKNVSRVTIGQPSAVTTTLSSLLEYDSEDLDGTRMNTNNVDLPQVGNSRHPKVLLKRKTIRCRNRTKFMIVRIYTLKI